MSGAGVTVTRGGPLASVEAVEAMQDAHRAALADAAVAVGRDLRAARLALGWSLRRACREAGIKRHHQQLAFVEIGQGWRPIFARRVAECYAKHLRRLPSHRLTIEVAGNDV